MVWPPPTQHSPRSTNTITLTLAMHRANGPCPCCGVSGFNKEEGQLPNHSKGRSARAATEVERELKWWGRRRRRHWTKSLGSGGEVHRNDKESRDAGAGNPTRKGTGERRCRMLLENTKPTVQCGMGSTEAWWTGLERHPGAGLYEALGVSPGSLKTASFLHHVILFPEKEKCFINRSTTIISSPATSIPQSFRVRDLPVFLLATPEPGRISSMEWVYKRERRLMVWKVHTARCGRRPYVSCTPHFSPQPSPLTPSA